MKPGDIIEFANGDDHLLAVITRELGQKFIVVTEEGDEMRPTPDEVTFEYGRRIDTDLSSDQIAERLQSLRGDIDAVADEVDPEFLWEFVQGGGEVSAVDMAELFFESSQPAKVLPVLQSLRDDPLYFKQNKSGFAPREPSTVEQLREQREARLRKERRRQAFVDGVVEVLEVEDQEEREALADEKMGDPDFRKFANILQQYAIYDKDYGERDEALEFLEAIEEGVDRQLKGGYGQKAFWLMVEMGIWSEHENLWMHRYNLGGGADDEVVEAAEEVDADQWEPESWRRDLTDRFAFSIDDASTLDIDDALSCRRMPDGSWEVGVHIADPGAFVAPDSRLDKHARGRATSIYLPTGTLPMFPRQLSEEAASLVAGRTRPALSLLVTFGEDLSMRDHEIVPSVVEVDERLTYEEADALIDGEGDGPLAEPLAKLRQLADQRRDERLDEGAVSIDLPDPKVRVEWEDGEATVRCEPESRQSPAHELVSEFMILTNTLLGEFCREHEIPAIFRSQEAPDVDLNEEEQVQSVPEGYPRMFAMLRHFKSGNTSTEPGYHFGLGVNAYTQSTSPIRRYTDLVTQRQIKAFLADEPLPYDQDEMVQLLAVVQTTGSQAGRVQYETERYWILEYLRRTEEPLEATMVEHKNHDGTRAAVWVHRVAQKFNARFNTAVDLGESTEVTVESADPRRDQVSLRGAEQQGGEGDERGESDE